MSDLWFEKYRPTNFKDYVWKDNSLKFKVSEWLEEESFPHLLLTGTQGTGKTSLINVILNEFFNKQILIKSDILYINASEETSVDVIRNKVLSFSSSVSSGNFRVVILEEAEQMSPNAQAALKRIMEDNEDNCRFILTSNNPQKLIAPIHSRCQTIVFHNIDEEQFLLRMIQILEKENIKYTDELLEIYYRIAYPDLRKAIGLLQLNSINNVLEKPSNLIDTKQEYMLEMVELFKKGKITEAREFIIKNADLSEYDSIYRWLYKNVDLFGKSSEQKDSAILVIAEAIKNSSFVADQEINLSACLIQLKRVYEGK